MPTNGSGPDEEKRKRPCTMMKNNSGREMLAADAGYKDRSEYMDTIYGPDHRDPPVPRTPPMCAFRKALFPAAALFKLLGTGSHLVPSYPRFFFLDPVLRRAQAFHMLAHRGPPGFYIEARSLQASWVLPPVITSGA